MSAEIQINKNPNLMASNERPRVELTAELVDAVLREVLIDTHVIFKRYEQTHPRSVLAKQDPADDIFRELGIDPDKIQLDPEQ